MSEAEQLMKAVEEELLNTIEKLEKGHDVDKIINEYCRTRFQTLSSQLKKVIEGNGGLNDAIAIITGFYQTGEYKSLYLVWLLATKPEYREHIIELLAPLLATEKLIAAYMQKSKS
jgi:hypothetical protein